MNPQAQNTHAQHVPALIDATFPQAQAPVTMILLQGRPWWIARQVGKALGYPSEGRHFPQRILKDWSDRMEHGKHFILLEGDALAAFKELVRKA